MPRAKTATNNSVTKKRKTRGNQQGTVYYDPKRDVYRWSLTLGYVNGKRQSINGQARTKTQADKELAAARTDAQRGLLTAHDDVKMKEYAARFLARQRHIADRTKQLHEVHLNYALEFLGETRVRDVTPRILNDMFSFLAQRDMKSPRTPDKKMSERTQKKVRDIVRNLLREAVAERIIPLSPMDALRTPRGSQQERQGTALSFQQFEQLRCIGETLYAAGQCRLWPAVFTALTTGLRRGEVMGLMWDCVDFERNVIRVRRQLTTDTTGVVLKERLKTKASKRDVPMPPSLKPVLLQHKARQEAERIKAGGAWQDTNLVFASSIGTWTAPFVLNTTLQALVHWSKPETFAKRVKGGLPREVEAALQVWASERAALPALMPHDLRRTYATLSLRRGMSIEVLSRLLGHARISITFDKYRFVLEEEVRGSVVDLGERLVVRSLPSPKAS